MSHDWVRAGADAVEERISRLRWRGVRYAVVDALSERDLRTVADAAADMPLVTGSAGLAPHLRRAHRRGRARAAAPPEPALAPGPTAILAGSCSPATLEQVARARRVYPSLKLDASASTSGQDIISRCAGWLDDTLAAGPVAMLYSSAPASERSAHDAATVERVMGGVARHLVDRGVRRLVVAGGETSAAVIDAIGMTGCSVGPEEARGVPWLFSADGRGLALLLKSGNFGDPELFVRASERQA